MCLSILPPTCQGLNTPGCLLLSYIPELKYLRELVLSLYSPSKAHPKQLLSCQLVSCDVGMREHPKSRRASPSVWGGQRNREKSQYPDFEEWAPVAMAGGCCGAVPLRVPGCSLCSCSEASVPLQWPPPVPKQQLRSCFGWLLCQLCSLCLQKAKCWLVWQPYSEHPRMLNEEQALWRRHWGVSGGGSSCAKG